MSRARRHVGHDYRIEHWQAAASGIVRWQTSDPEIEATLQPHLREKLRCPIKTSATIVGRGMLRKPSVGEP